MSDQQAIPEFDASYFDHDDGVNRMAQILGGFINNEMPAVIIRQPGEVIDDITQEAIVVAGYEAGQPKLEGVYKATAWKLIKSFPGFPIRNTSHIEGNGYKYFDNGMSIRRHDAVKLAARVSMRSAKMVDVGSPSHRLNVFKKDKDKPKYTGIQQPGDRVIFPLYGGFLDGQLVLPSEHKFQLANRFEGIRTVALRDFAIKPKQKLFLG